MAFLKRNYWILTLGGLLVLAALAATTLGQGVSDRPGDPVPVPVAACCDECRHSFASLRDAVASMQRQLADAQAEIERIDHNFKTHRHAAAAASSKNQCYLQNGRWVCPNAAQ